MLKKIERNKDFDKLITGLDISLTMYDSAVEKYENLGKYLEKNGITCEIYPQGSFATGTVVRPYKNGKELDYDLDFICKVIIKKSETSPKKAREEIIEILKQSDVYRNRWKEYDKCITLEYAEVNNVGFNMDLVNGVEEDEKFNIVHGVAITNKTNDKEYEWNTINPKAYTQWFDKENQLFIDYIKLNKSQDLLECYRDSYSSIEEIPNHFIKTPLQRVIQILKRHRDVFLYKKQKQNKIISSIIVTLCTQIASKASKSFDTWELLEYILKEFAYYSDLNQINESSENNFFKLKRDIEKINGEWVIKNPVNPEDNFADYWNDSPQVPKLFFEWIKAVQDELIGSFEKSDEEFLSLLESAVGTSYLEKIIEKERYQVKYTKELETPKKSWRSE